MTTLLQNIDEPMEIIIERTAESKEESNWKSCLTEMPVFTLKEKEKHREKCGKGQLFRDDCIQPNFP